MHPRARTHPMYRRFTRVAGRPTRLIYGFFTGFLAHPFARLLGKTMGAGVLLVSFLIAQPTAAADGDWMIDNAGSTLSFVSVKAGDVAETHTFGQLSGGVRPGAGTSAEINMTVHLATVNTNIPVRDERMRNELFKVSEFPLAKVHGHLSLGEYLSLPVGDSLNSSLKLMLDLHGTRIPVTAEVLVSRLSDNRVMVVSSKAIIVNAASVGLVDGIETLRKLAGLPCISRAVPVSFVLTLVR